MKKRFLLSVIFLIIGVIIYVVYRNGIMVKDNIVLSAIRNYLPDVCWTLSFYYASVNFAFNISKNYILLNSIYVFLISIVFEFLQYFGIVEGTYDILDILIYLTSIIFACLIEIIIRRKENEKNW